MKRISLFIVMAVTLAVAWPATIGAQVFSDPIPIGGDDDTSPAASQHSDATSLDFFVHPKVSGAGDKNFLDDTGLIKPDGYGNSYIDDIAASPGHATHDSVSATDEVMDQPEPRGSGSSYARLNSIGPSDFVLLFHLGSGGSVYFKLGIDLLLQSGGRNESSYRFLLGDIRPGDMADFSALFSDPSSPLPNAHFLFSGVDKPLIGFTYDELPYQNRYPAPVIKRTGDQAPFRWCLNMLKHAGPYKGYEKCYDAAKQVSSNEYTEVFLYDFAPLFKNGFAATSYDPLILAVDGEGYLGYEQGAVSVDASAPLTSALFSWFNPLQYNRYAYYSPITFFRKYEDSGSQERFKFAGYSSWFMPVIDLLGLSDFLSFDWMLNKLQFIATNWILPTATNPIAIEAVDLDGASSPVGDPKDTDFAVAYQAPLFDLDTTIFDAFGRPLSVGNGAPMQYRDILGLCDTPACGTFTKLSNAAADIGMPQYFPDDVVSLALLWKQQNAWHVGGDTGAMYLNMNPSHAFNPNRGAIVGPGVYSMAVLTDHAGDPAARAQQIVVPSQSVPVVPGEPRSALYFIDPLNAQNLYIKVVRGEVLSMPTAEVCNEKVEFKKTQLLMPKAYLVERPPAGSGVGYLPYEVRSGNLDGDACEDLIITWRGALVQKDALHPDQVVFSDASTSGVFSDRLTIVLRREAMGGCDVWLPQDYAATHLYPISATVSIPTYIDLEGVAMGPAQVASADIGDVDNDGDEDIVIGNYVPEGSGPDKTAYAYVFYNNGNFPFSSVNSEKVRVGFHSGDDMQGVGKIKIDHNQYGADSIAAINGRPLMLPEMGCSQYSLPDDMVVQSPHETYTSIYENLASKWVINHTTDLFSVYFPFEEATTHRPVAQRCVVPQEFCTAAGSISGDSYPLPLYAADACCKETCAMDWVVFQSTDCYKYLKAMSNFSCSAYNYLKEYESCLSSALPADDTDTMLASDDRGEGGGGGSEFAEWRPDSVMEDNYGAIAYATALMKADLPVYKFDPLKKHTSAQMDSFLGLRIPLQKILLSILDASINIQPSFEAQVEELKASGDLAKAEKALNRNLAFLLSGPVTDELTLFGRGMFAAFIADDSIASGSSSSGSSGCSLIANEGSSDLSDFIAKVESAAAWLWDVIVPDADAAACGAGDVEGTQKCNSAHAAFGGADTICFVGDSSAWPGSVETTCHDDYVCYGPKEVEAGVDPCECFRPSCGDGCFIASIPAAGYSEICDTTAYKTTIPASTNYGCPLDHSCIAPGLPGACTCTDGACGDGQVNLGEECDFAVTDLDAYPNKGCPVGQTCASSACTCTGAPPVVDIPLNPDVKLPKGMLMPDYREMTAVMLMSPDTPTCNHNNALDVGLGEECDVTIAPDHTTGSAYMTAVETQCAASGAFLPAGHVWWDCTTGCFCATMLPDCLSTPSAECVNDADCLALGFPVGSHCLSSCTCQPPDLTGCAALPVPPNCHSSADCGPDQYCEAGDCLCHDVPPGTNIPGEPGEPGETPPTVDLITQTNNGCIVRCEGYSTEGNAQAYMKWNKQAREWVGSDPIASQSDLFCEPEQRVHVVCRVGGSSTVAGADLSLLASSSSPLAGSENNQLPYMVVQNGGSQFIDIGTLEFKDYTLVSGPLRILPMDGTDPATMSVKAAVLPNLSASADYAGLEGVAPMATTSVRYGSGGAIEVNNMIQHRMFAVTPGQDFSVTIGGSAQTIKAQAVDLPTGTAVTIHDMIFMVPPDCASWTQLEGYKQCPPIEERDFNAQAVKATIESNVSGGVTGWGVFSNTPWEQNLNYTNGPFQLVSEVYTKAGTTGEDQATQVVFGWDGGLPLSSGLGGGGCGCYLAAGEANLGSIVPFILIMALPTAGIAIRAVRRKRRR